MIVALMLGCTSWIDQEPSCDQDIYSWSDDLLAFVLTGDGSGEFDFDPDDTPRTSVSGEYSPSDGDFDWKFKYDEDFYLKTAKAVGFGTVFHDGDLDLLWTETVTDMLDVATETTYRVQRDECDMTIATWDASGTADDAFVMAGSYDDGEVWSWTSEGSGYTAQGALRQNLSRTTQFEYTDGRWKFANAKPDGETDLEYTGEWIDGYYCEGTSTLHFEGDTEGEMYVYEGDTLEIYITSDHEWDGSGVEHQEYRDGLECDFTTDSGGDCSYECTDGQNGSC
jgi:hypothetical protein